MSYGREWRAKTKAFLVRLVAVLVDGRVDCIRPGSGECCHSPPVGRTHFLGAGQGPPLLGLLGNDGPRPFKEDEGASTRGRLAPAEA